LPVPVPAARWQSFVSPPDAPELLELSEGLPASAPEPVEPPPPLFPFMLLPPVPLVPEFPPLVPDVLLPDDVPLPEFPPPELPELPDDWAIAEVASASASADVARIFMIMSIAFQVGSSLHCANPKQLPLFQQGKFDSANVWERTKSAELGQALPRANH
jgi:hypothetical protein